MSDYFKTMAGETALMEALSALDSKEKLIAELLEKLEACQAKLNQVSSGDKGSASQQQLDQLMKVNHQWDLEYRQLEDKMKILSEEHERTIQEYQTTIAQLKADNSDLSHELDCLNHGRPRPSQDSQFEINGLKREVSQYEKIIASLKQRNATLEDQVSRGGARFDGRRLKQLEEDNNLLKQQVAVYKDDFEAECRDRERLSDEKQSLALRFEAELTSYKLQLDRCRNELQHYTTEATRLQQQLRLKNEYEGDQFKRHLESRGYVSRGGVPPLDPYVEHDPPTHQAGRHGNQSPHPPKTTAMVPGPSVRINNGYIMQNGGVVSPPTRKPRVECDDGFNGVTKNSAPAPPPSKCRHKCPRCARRFEKNFELTDHMSRCIS